MKLSNEGLKNRAEWEVKGYQLPQYDREKMVAATKENPFWLHFGAGNLFRAFHAKAAENMLCDGTLDRGITAIVSPDYEVYEKHYLAHDTLGIVATLKADGSIEKKVVGAVAEAVPYDAESEEHFGRLKEIFAKESVQLATFTITEKGYSIVNPDGSYKADTLADFEAGPEKPVSYMGKLTALLYERFKAGQLGMALVSTDNCSHNGDILKAAVLPYAKAWEENGKVDAGFAAYVDSEKLAFTWSMIDKITPRPDAQVEAMLTADGIEDLEPVLTKRGTPIALFVNAEEAEYLVIEDNFPNGRPELEKGGLMFTEKETVDKVEKMKVCTCLNPLHTALAVMGCVLGHTKISEEMKDPELKALVEVIGYKEGLPVVVNPGILDPKEFIDTVLTVRIPNPFMPDTPQRIATDTSQKLPIRFGETIKAYAASDELNVADLKCIPLVFAGWLRYLMGVNDAGETFELSGDPMHDTVCPIVAGIKLGEEADIETIVEPILSNAKIFGVNLYEVGLADTVIKYFREMLKGPGAIRETLKRYVY